MYIVQDKQTQHILHCHPAAVSDNLTGQQVYSAFDADTMVLLRSHLNELPVHFQLDGDDLVVAMSNEEKIRQGIISFEQLFGVNANLTNAAGQQDDFAKVQFVLDNELIDSHAKGALVLGYLSAQIETDIAAKYSQGVEMKLHKAYSAWLVEGQPAGDAREQAYVTMNADIEAIKSHYKPQREQVQSVINTLTQ